MLGLFAQSSKTYDPRVAAQQFKQTLTTPSNQIEFSLTNDEHLSRIKECTLAVNEQLSILKHRDEHIAIGFGIGVCALVLSPILPFGLTIAMSGVAYGAYFLGGRDDPYNKFNIALEHLAHCCDWALSDIKNEDKFTNEIIQDMLKTLAPLVTQADLITIMGNEEEANTLLQGLDVLNKHMNPSKAPFKLAMNDEYNYHLYGYRRGGSLDSLINVLRISFHKAFTFACQLFINEASKTTTTPAPSI